MRAPRFGLIGHPVGHSLSPDLHVSALRHLGLAGTYEAVDVPPDGLASMLEALRRGDFGGLNVTVPHKVAVVDLCDRLHPDAERLGAVNTLVRAADGAVAGHNTDLLAMVRCLEALGAPLAGRPTCILGAGGAARAAAGAALLVGASEIRVLNRTRARADALADALGAPVVAEDDPQAACEDAALLIQATTLGMGTQPGSAPWRSLRDQADAVLEGLPPGAAVFDLVYSPAETPWLAAARARGFVAAGGLDMLVRQAALSLGLWLGREVDPASMAGGLPPSRPLPS